MSTVDLPDRPWSPDRARTVQPPYDGCLPRGTYGLSNSTAAAGPLVGSGRTVIVTATRLPAFATGLATWLGSKETGWRVIDTDDAATAAELARGYPADAVVATDDIDGVALGAGLAGGVPLLVLLGAPNRDREVALVRSGACGILGADVNRATLVDAVAALISGRSVIGVATLRAVAAQESQSPGLSTRQVEIVQMLSEGLTTREIARRLFVTPSTVKTHIARIGDKLGVQGRWAVATTAPAFLVGDRGRGGPMLG